MIDPSTHRNYDAGANETDVVLLKQVNLCQEENGAHSSLLECTLGQYGSILIIQPTPAQPESNYFRLRAAALEVKVIAVLLDVPVHSDYTDTLHVIFTLYSEFKNNPHFSPGLPQEPTCRAFLQLNMETHLRFRFS